MTRVFDNSIKDNQVNLSNKKLKGLSIRGKPKVHSNASTGQMHSKEKNWKNKIDDQTPSRQFVVFFIKKRTSIHVECEKDFVIF